MWSGILFLLVGIFFLWAGADLLVRGSSRLAASFGVKKVIIGLTLVAFGTSTPELVVTMMSAFKGVQDIGLGNIVGSNIANTLLILGTAAIFLPLNVHRQMLRIDLPVMLFFTVMMMLLGLDGRYARWEGAMLFLCFLGYLMLTYRNRREDDPAALPELRAVPLDRLQRERWKNVLLSVTGIVGLYFGGEGTVRGAIQLAKTFGLPEVLVGLTIVAVGTSLPELFTSVVAIIRGEDDISLGNIVGSNIFNIGLVLGLVIMVHPLTVNVRVIHFDFLFLLGVSALVSICFYWLRRVPRGVGIALLVLYGVYVYCVYI